MSPTPSSTFLIYTELVTWSRPHLNAVLLLNPLHSFATSPTIHRGSSHPNTVNTRYYIGNIHSITYKSIQRIGRLSRPPKKNHGSKKSRKIYFNPIVNYNTHNIFYSHFVYNLYYPIAGMQRIKDDPIFSQPTRYWLD